MVRLANTAYSFHLKTTGNLITSTGAAFQINNLYHFTNSTADDSRVDGSEEPAP